MATFHRVLQRVSSLPFLSACSLPARRNTIKKYDLINVLARKHGYTRYLEISTPRTGMRFAEVDEAILTTKHRIFYHAPGNISDGLEVTHRTPEKVSYRVVAALLDDSSAAASYDIVFVDSYHSYEASMSDMLGALCLLRPGGVMIVHDCSPARWLLKRPLIGKGYWCGASYQAFIDLTLPRRDLHSYTVNCDFGCGVVLKSPTSSTERDLLQFNWYVASLARDTRFDYFDRHRQALLNLVDEKTFYELESIPVPENHVFVPEPVVVPFSLPLFLLKQRIKRILGLLR